MCAYIFKKKCVHICITFYLRLAEGYFLKVDSKSFIWSVSKKKENYFLSFSIADCHSKTILLSPTLGPAHAEVWDAG